MLICKFLTNITINLQENLNDLPISDILVLKQSLIYPTFLSHIVYIFIFRQIFINSDQNIS